MQILLVVTFQLVLELFNYGLPYQSIKVKEDFKDSVSCLSSNCKVYVEALLVKS